MKKDLQQVFLTVLIMKITLLTVIAIRMVRMKTKLFFTAPLLDLHKTIYGCSCDSVDANKVCNFCYSVQWELNCNTKNVL